MNKLSIGVAIITLAFASCKNAGNQKFEAPVPATSNTINVPATPAPSGNPDNQGIVTNPQAAPAGQTTNPQTNTALNPQHGQPGHRCDIPEGAPLNSPAINTTIPANGNSPILGAPQPSTNVRLNPEHGAPGHDCNIPVGQPLRS